MPVTSDRTILVMGSIEPQILAQLRALAPRYEIVLAAEAPLTSTDDLTEVAELLRAQSVQMVPVPRPKDSVPYYRRFDRRRHWR